MAYISKEDVKAIREELKATFPKFKFGVRKSTGSMSVIVNVPPLGNSSSIATMLRLILTTLVSTVSTQNSLRRLLRSSRLLQCVARVTIRKVGMIVQTQ